MQLEQENHAKAGCFDTERQGCRLCTSQYGQPGVYHFVT